VSAPPRGEPESEPELERGGRRIGDVHVGYTVESTPPRARGAAAPVSPASRAPKDEAGEAKRQSYETQKQAGRERERRKKRVEELERSIATSEKELLTLRDRLKAAPGDDWEKLARMAADEQALAKALDAMMSEWARLSEGEA
jgi:hypothetical protein